MKKTGHRPAVVWDSAERHRQAGRHSAAPRRPFYYCQDYRSRQPGSIICWRTWTCHPYRTDGERSASSSSTKLPQVSSQPFQQNPFWHLCGTRGRLRPPVDLTSPPATQSGGSPETTAAASPRAVQNQTPTETASSSQLFLTGATSPAEDVVCKVVGRISILHLDSTLSALPVFSSTSCLCQDMAQVDVTIVNGPGIETLPPGIFGDNDFWIAQYVSFQYMLVCKMNHSAFRDYLRWYIAA